MLLRLRSPIWEECMDLRGRIGCFPRCAIICWQDVPRGNHLHYAPIQSGRSGRPLIGRYPGYGYEVGYDEGENPGDWMVGFHGISGQGPQEPIEAGGALSSGALNMGRPCWEKAWTVRVVWISFRPSEPETWVRILHGPPLSLSFTGGFDDITEDLSTWS